MKSSFLLTQIEKQGFGKNQEEVEVLCRRLKGFMAEKELPDGSITKAFIRFGNIMFQAQVGNRFVGLFPHKGDDYWLTAPRQLTILPDKITYSQRWANKSDDKQVSLFKDKKVLNKKTGKMENKRVYVGPDTRRHYLKKTISIVARHMVWHKEEKVSKRCTSKVTVRTEVETHREVETAKCMFHLNTPEREFDLSRVLAFIAKEYNEAMAHAYKAALELRLGELVEADITAELAEAA